MKLNILTSALHSLQTKFAYESNKKITDGLFSKINSICNSSEEIKKPGVVNHNGICISQTGCAKQLVIMTHGGWKDIEKNPTMFRRQVGDGWTSVPDGTRIDFYTEDHSFTKGSSVLSEVNKRPHDALNGLEPSIELNDSDLELLARSRNMSVSGLKDEMMKLATYRKECINGGDAVKNYALYHHEYTDALIEKHQYGDYNRDIDIAFVTEKKHKKHLSDVFEAIKKTEVEYKVIHFGACRVERGGHAISGIEHYDSKK